MIVCQTLAQAIAVPNVVVVVASNPPVAYQQGDAIPVGTIVDNSAAMTRLSGLDAQINAASLGSVSLQTIPQLKQMDWPTYSAWFDANFTTAAQAITLLKSLLLVVIRRVL